MPKIIFDIIKDRDILNYFVLYTSINSVIYYLFYPNLSKLNNHNYRSKYKMTEITHLPSIKWRQFSRPVLLITFLWDFTNRFGFLRSYPTIGSYLGRLFSHEQGWKVEEGLLHIRPLINPLCKQSQSLFNSAPLYPVYFAELRWRMVEIADWIR